MIEWAGVEKLIGVADFSVHREYAKANGFELFEKRAVIGRGKHLRVRPMFRKWSAVGVLDVIDEEMSGLSKEVLGRILKVSGALCGVGDWRPSAPSSGSYGKFTSVVTEM
jgi:hypothetical protein